MNQREAIVGKIHSIPAMPASASAVIGLLKDPDVEMSDLMHAIEYDQGLTSNILRLANSAYFAGPRTVGSLKEALVRLGTNRIFQLVITAAVMPIAHQEIRGYDIPSGKLFEESIAVAVGAEELAVLLNRKPPAHAFTSGLLHDLGKVVLGTFLEINVQPIREMAFSQKISFEVAEACVLGIDHSEAGAMLLEHWELPKNIVEVVRYHHRPEMMEGDRLVVDLVHVADTVAMETGLGAGVDGLNYQPSSEVISRLRIRPAVLETMACRMMEAVEEFRNVLQT
jgi:HD-like signal output (HDOD) protein